MLVGRAADEHLDAVETELGRRGARVARVDSDRWPLPSGPGQRTPSERWRYRGVLCRSVEGGRPVAHHAERCARTSWEPDGALERISRFAVDQARLALLGLLAAVDADVWVDDPWAIARAEVKATQLSAAEHEGLRVPRTLISDDPKAIRAFASDVQSVVFKSLGDPLVWEQATRAGFLYTTEVTEDLLHDLDERTPVAGIFQERLVARAEHRVTVVGDQVFAARTAVSPGSLDWRRDLRTGIAFERSELDTQSVDAIRRIVARLGLQFAAVDLLETDDGLWFLELNPCAAYGWLERRLGLPITHAICNLLVGTE